MLAFVLNLDAIPREEGACDALLDWIVAGTGDIRWIVAAGDARSSEVRQWLVRHQLPEPILRNWHVQPGYHGFAENWWFGMDVEKLLKAHDGVTTSFRLVCLFGARTVRSIFGIQGDVAAAYRMTFGLPNENTHELPVERMEALESQPRSAANGS